MGDALDPSHDSGDHLHPNDAGYGVCWDRAMAASFSAALEDDRILQWVIKNGRILHRCH